MDNNFKNKWINASTLRPFQSPDIIVFKEGKIHYSILQNSKNKLNLKEKKVEDHFEKLSDLNFKFIDNNRIRFYRKGKSYNASHKTESRTEIKVFEQDYVRLLPTKLKISESRIQLLKYKVVWNNEEIVIEFNKILDRPEIQKINKERNREGTKILLEKLDETLFISIFNNNKRGLIMSIKEIDENKAILYGFPTEPFEITAKIAD